MFNLPHSVTYLDSIYAFLKEDWGTQDWTAASVPDRFMEARVVAKAGLVLAGLPMAVRVVRAVDPQVSVALETQDGDEVASGTVVMRLAGSSRSILMAERVMLNLLQRLTGTATLTRAFVVAVQGTRARILDTRKTTPGLRLLEKYAVRASGGHNHRYSLSDGVLIKDNHIAACGSITEAVRRVRARVPHTINVEVETDTLAQVEECLACGVGVIMLDNMDLVTMRQAVALIDGRAIIEASGGVNLQTVRSIAETGVDIISVGALTHSAKACDIGMDWRS